MDIPPSRTRKATLMFLAIPVTASTEGTKFMIVLVATLIGFNYGANLSLFPSFTKDLWGLKSFGVNYGILFTAWGVGGFALSRLSQMLYEASKDAMGKGNYQSSFIIGGILLIACAALTLLIKPQSKAGAVAPAK